MQATGIAGNMICLSLLLILIIIFAINLSYSSKGVVKKNDLEQLGQTVSKYLKDENTHSQGQFENLKMQFEEIRKDIKNFEPLKLKLSPELEQTAKNALDDSIKKLDMELKADWQKKITSLEQQLQKLAQDKIFGNEQAAELAYQKSLQLTKDGNFEQARIYCLNAINHAPYKKQYISGYMNIYNELKTKTSLDDLNQIRSILELAVYQVNAEDVSEIQKMISSIAADQEAVSNAIAKKALEEQKNQFNVSLNALQNGKYSWKLILKDGIIGDVKLLQERLELVTSMKEFVPADDVDLIAKIVDETVKTTAAYEYTAKISLINSCLTQAESLLGGVNSTSDMPTISSQVQTANSLLSQIWGIDMAQLPEGMKNSASISAQRIVNIEKSFNKIRSKPAITIIISTVEEAEKAYQDKVKITEKITRLIDCSKKISANITEICDRDEQKKYIDGMEAISKRIGELSKIRYQKYQEWAIDECNGAFKKYLSWKRVDEKDAKSVIDGYLLPIDQSILTPEVSALYNDILRKQYTEMTGPVVAVYQAKIASAKKKSLEDF